MSAAKNDSLRRLVRHFRMRRLRKLVRQRQSQRIVGTMIGPIWNGPITWEFAEAMMWVPWPAYTTIIIYDKRFRVRPNKPLSGTEAASGSVYARKDGST